MESPGKPPYTAKPGGSGIVLEMILKTGVKAFYAFC
jgi:hypothetical protein